MPSPIRFCVRRSPAPAPPGANVTVALQVPSEVECIEEAVALVTRHCLTGGDVRENFRFRLQVALSEALANAILRGNQQDHTKHVDVRLELAPTSIRISVTDEGEGFDPDAVPDPLAAPRLLDDRGRGLFLIRRLVDAVEFNERGNSICMILNRP